MKILKTTSIAITLCFGSLLITAAANAAPVRPATRIAAPARTHDESVRAVLNQLSDAATAGDAAKMAALFTVDGSYIDEDGIETAGRAALERRFAAGLAAQGKTKTTVNAQGIKFIGANAAFLEGVTCKVSPEGQQACARFTILLQKQANQWLIASATETEIVQKPVIENTLSSLNWLIGSWSTSVGKAKVTMHADWVGNKNFILCKYVIERPGAQPKVDVQIIGWDSMKQSIVSWNFDSSGGFGNGTWTKQGKEWLNRTKGIEQAGVETGATNIISVEGGNRFTWRSIDRIFDGTTVPNTEPLIVERVGRVTQ